MDISKELVKGIKVHSTLEQEVLVTTSDKLRLCLIRHQKTLSGRFGWVAPLGMLLTLVITLLTTDFSNSLGLSQHTWKAIFILSSILVGLWLVCSVAKNAGSILHGLIIGYEGTIEDIVNEMKAETSEITTLISAQDTQLRRKSPTCND